MIYTLSTPVVINVRTEHKRPDLLSLLTDEQYQGPWQSIGASQMDYLCRSHSEKTLKHTGNTPDLGSVVYNLATKKLSTVNLVESSLPIHLIGRHMRSQKK